MSHRHAHSNESLKCTLRVTDQIIIPSHLARLEQIHNCASTCWIDILVSLILTGGVSFTKLEVTKFVYSLHRTFLGCDDSTSYHHCANTDHHDSTKLGRINRTENSDIFSV